MSLLGKKVKLTGITQKGKNRVRDHSNEWMVLAETDTILFAPNQPGPWIFVSPVGCDQNHRASRWVKLSGDPDFLVSDLSTQV